MSAAPQLSWSKVTRWRGECGQRFGTILQIPIVVSPYVEFIKLLQPNSCVLDIGAGVEKPVQKYLKGQQYFSLDSDPEGDFDYHSFNEMEDHVKFDLMVANQVLEHLTIVETYDVLNSAEKHLISGGVLLATVPNTAHPVRQWDPTHITPWPMSDLYSMFRNAGFEVVMMARYNKYILTRNPLKRFIITVVCNTFRVDWCDSLMIVGKK